jgi:hypothetical protein
MISGLEENRAANWRRLLGLAGETLGGQSVNDVHQARLSALEDATLSK